MFLNKHQVATYDDLNSKIIKVWGGEIKLRVMNVKEQQEYAKLIEENKEEKDIFYFLIKKCCLGENDVPIFDNNDNDILDNKSVNSLTYIVKEILDLNKQQNEDVKDLAKNS